jgi:hypothetical protein
MANGILKINRGDYFSFNISIEDDTQPTGIYELQPNDILYFALLAPHKSFEDAIILRGYTYNDAIKACTAAGPIHIFNIELTRKDTIDLSPGVYYYTFKLQKNAKSALLGLEDPNADLTTIVERTKFIINE